MATDILSEAKTRLYAEHEPLSYDALGRSDRTVRGTEYDPPGRGHLAVRVRFPLLFRRD